MSRNTYLKLTSLEEAKALWLSTLCPATGGPLRHEAVPLQQAHGRTLAQPATACVSSPAFHGAAMDGVAVKAEDTFGASEHSPKTLTLGTQAHWINTGHPLPKGTDAVIMVEHIADAAEYDPTVPKGQAVVIEKAAFPWQHVRKLGEDMVATETLIAPGVIVGPYELGALAAAGVTSPMVFAKPKVVFIPSGSEIKPLADITPEMLASGKVLPEFNSLVIRAMVEDAGGECEVYPVVPDDPAAIRAAIEKAAQSGADLIVMNAGSSAGSRDYTAQVIQEAGELWVHGITIMPGKPTVLGRVGGKPVIGLPGYPVSAIISFEELGQPLLARWQGRTHESRPTATAHPFQAIPSRPGMEEFVRVTLGQVDDTLVAVPLPRGAGTVTTLSRADGFLRIAKDSEGIPAQAPSSVSLIRSRQHIAGALLAIGSHDNALDLLDSFLRKQFPLYSLASAHVGSMGGLMALKEGRCHLAGTHLLDPATGKYNQAAISQHLPGMALDLVRLVDREQGLIVPRGNPQGISSIACLAKEGITFINRQRGSGTRVLLDWRMAELGMKPAHIAGYEDEEYTHMNVAAAVLSGRASTGLGVRAAANALGLDFIPVGVEEYDIAIPARFRDDARIVALLEVIRSAAFKQEVLALGGYGVESTGTLIASLS